MQQIAQPKQLVK